MRAVARAAEREAWGAPAEEEEAARRASLTDVELRALARAHFRMAPPTAAAMRPDCHPRLVRPLAYLDAAHLVRDLLVRHMIGINADDGGDAGVRVQNESIAAPISAYSFAPPSVTFAHAGSPLPEVIESAPLPLRIVIAQQIDAVLDALEARGLVHTALAPDAFRIDVWGHVRLATLTDCFCAGTRVVCDADETFVSFFQSTVVRSFRPPFMHGEGVYIEGGDDDACDGRDGRGGPNARDGLARFRADARVHAYARALLRYWVYTRGHMGDVDFPYLFAVLRGAAQRSAAAADFAEAAWVRPLLVPRVEMLCGGDLVESLDHDVAAEARRLTYWLAEVTARALREVATVGVPRAAGGPRVSSSPSASPPARKKRRGR